MSAGSPDSAESSSRESQRLRVGVKTRDHWKEPLTTAREAAGVTTSPDCRGNEIKPCRIPIKVSFPQKKIIKKKSQHGPLLKIETSCCVLLGADLALHEDSRGSNKNYMFGSLQEQDTQAERNGEGKGH